MSAAVGFTQEIAGIGHNGGPKITDRPYQTEAVQSIWTYFQAKQGNPVVAMPTGTGKSIVIARFLQ
jgi:superfamily II DNA or RNA helicase